MEKQTKESCAMSSARQATVQIGMSMIDPEEDDNKWSFSRLWLGVEALVVECY